ncbi:MAG TPA: PDZ domain-containing protein [Thermoanaerobaculia bacterium]|jgi:hypothetical protein|nr:PDZ domain-containing protein [Thermoanaerobaculia bacterium]
MRRTALLISLLLSVVVLLAGCSGLYYSNPDLQTTGVSARAEILETWETGIKVNDEPVIGLKVRVTPTDGTPYEATIKRVLISQLEIPRFQPGAVIPVRYDPKDLSRVSIDLSPGTPAKVAKTGNPYHDYFAAAKQEAALMPPPAAPEIYRGSSDDTADLRALNENGYVPLGYSEVAKGGSDARQAIDQGKQIGASLLVLYGEPFDMSAGQTIAALPFHPGFASGEAGTIGSAPQALEEGRLVVYWAKVRPPVFGVFGRQLSAEEKTRLRRNNGMFVSAVAKGSPAAAAGIQEGDVILAIDGKQILDVTAVPAFLTSIAGKKVRIELVRNGSPLAMDVQLNQLNEAAR